MEYGDVLTGLERNTTNETLSRNLASTAVRRTSDMNGSTHAIKDRLIEVI